MVLHILLWLIGLVGLVIALFIIGCILYAAGYAIWDKCTDVLYDWAACRRLIRFMHSDPLAKEVDYADLLTDLMQYIRKCWEATIWFTLPVIVLIGIWMSCQFGIGVGY